MGLLFQGENLMQTLGWSGLQYDPFCSSYGAAEIPELGQMTWIGILSLQPTVCDLGQDPYTKERFPHL